MQTLLRARESARAGVGGSAGARDSLGGSSPFVPYTLRSETCSIPAAPGMALRGPALYVPQDPGLDVGENPVLLDVVVGLVEALRVHDPLPVLKRNSLEERA